MTRFNLCSRGKALTATFFYTTDKGGGD